MIVVVQLALISIFFCIIIISMASRNPCDGSVSMTDAEEVEEIFVDSMFIELTDACNLEFFLLQNQYKKFDLRRFEPQTVAFLNYEWKANGVLFPIEEVVSVDCTTYIWQVLCDTYPENELLSHLHEATILQLFILLPYEIDEAKIELFDCLNRTEFVEQPGFVSIRDDKGVVRSILRDGPLWEEIPVVVVPVSSSDCLVGGGGGGEIQVDIAPYSFTNVAAVCGGSNALSVGDSPLDLVVDMDVVDTPVVDPAVHVAPAVVDSTPIATVIGGKKSLPAEPSVKPAVRFFDPRSSTAKKERLQLLESRRLSLDEEIAELTGYIEEGKKDLKEVSNIIFADGEDVFSPEECTVLIKGLIESSKEKRSILRKTLRSVNDSIKSWYRAPTISQADRVEAAAQKEENERRDYERKENDRARHRHEKMTAEQIAAA